MKGDGDKVSLCEANLARSCGKELEDQNEDGRKRVKCVAKTKLQGADKLVVKELFAGHRGLTRALRT